MKNTREKSLQIINDVLYKGDIFRGKFRDFKSI